MRQVDRAPEEQQSTIFDFPLSSQFAVLTLSSVLVVFLSWFIRRVRAGYREFVALGPGGTPSTFSGYLRVSVLRVFALKNPLSPPRIPADLRPQNGILKKDVLPTRQGSRPKIVGIAPQRQMSHRGPPAMYEQLCEKIGAIAQQNRDRLYLGTSCFEKHSTGLFSRAKLQNRPPTCKGEVCHSHPSDGSMHLTLHPADVKLVMEQGWGERHPLARERWWWGSRCVPTGFMMIYAPRSVEELEGVTKVVHAAAWWVNGMEPRWTGLSGTSGPVGQDEDEEQRAVTKGVPNWDDIQPSTPLLASWSDGFR